jgi:rod shape determining protein RodA
MTPLRRPWLHLDWPLFITLVPLLGMSLLNLYSATRVAPKGLFSQQLLFYGLGTLLLIFGAALDYRRLLRLAWPIYLGTSALLVAVLVIGRTVNGSKRWLGLGVLGGQPSELMKLALILIYARLFASDPLDLKERPLRYALLWHLLLGAPVLLILKEPDLGTALLCVVVAASMLLLVPLRARVKAWVIGLDLSAAVAVFLFGLKAYQKKRLLSFLHPESDPTGTGWHAQQAICAIGSGRLLGKGYLRGTQNQLQFLPEHWTDFPFAVWAEEWGLIGCLLLLGCYLVLILWAIGVCRDARDRFGRYLAIGIASLLFWHVAINVAMVVGMAPVVGVTLPFLSYGGSSLLVTLFALGLLGSISLRRYSY